MRHEGEADALEIDAHTFQIGDAFYALFGLELPKPRLPEGLTATERELVRCVLDGMSQAQIADSRGRSRHTVSNQLRGIYRKLGVDDRHGLIAHCMRNR